MTAYKKIINLFFAPIITVLLCTVITGCTDEEGLNSGDYGYVQFKLYKAASYESGEAEKTATRANGEIQKLDEIQKIEVELLYNGTSIIQTLVLNSYSSENAEFGMRSDKLQLLAGKYTIVGYKLLNKTDEQVDAFPINNEFEVIPGGLTVQDLTANVAGKGMVEFRLIKDWVQTRASSEPTYIFSKIDLVSVIVQNTFDQTTQTIEKIPVNYQLEYYGNDEVEDKESIIDIGDQYYTKETAVADSLIWLPAGDYRVVGYTTYRESGVNDYTLEIQTGLDGKEFKVEDNKITENAEVPIQLKETAEYLKDYQALYEIWKALDGPHWKYVGEAYAQGSNWNFNKEMDMWGMQPGVELDENGRVASLTLAGFGASGKVPDAIGQLKELKILSFGAHDEKIGGHLFGKDGISLNMSDEKLKEVRQNYANLFLKTDPRENLSEMLQDAINRDPKQKPIKKFSGIDKKDVQVGVTTNNITAISKAVMRLTKLQFLFLANSPVKAEDVFVNFVDDEGTYYREMWEEELNDPSKEWSWSNFKDLTDMELYNCKNFKKIPDFVLELPELQVLNLACNKGIEDMGAEWNRLITRSNDRNNKTGETPVASKIQMLYLGYNKVGEFPPSENLMKMKNLHMLDCTNSGVTEVHAFGTDIVMMQLMLDYNEIKSIPNNFCKFSNEVESLSFSNNELTEIPNIFDAKSIYVMGSVNFDDNRISKVSTTDENGDPSEFKGINASTVSLANNRFEKFPKEIFEAESPIVTLNLAGNGLKEINEGDIVGKEGDRNEKASYLTTIDLRFNKLKKLPDDFRATGIPYLTGIDLSYNQFSEVPSQPLNCSELGAFGIRHQRDDNGARILKTWPVGITACPSLYQLQIGSNDIRKVDEEMTSRLWIVEVKDNPNISMDVTSVCSYINAGMWLLIYDKTQDIRGCDALGIEH